MTRHVRKPLCLIAASSVGCRGAVILVLLLVTGRLSAQDSAPTPTSRPFLEVLCDKLRAGSWSIEDFGSLTAMLVAEKRFLAADWWTSAAEAALKSGKLPPKAKSKVSEIRTKIDHENQPSTEARLIWARAGEQVRSLIDKKAPVQAGAALALAEQLAAAYPDPAWKRDVVSLKQRLGKLTDKSGEDKLKETDRKTTADLAARLTKDLEQRATRAVEEFRLYGCQPGVGMVDSLLRIRSDPDRYAADLKVFRNSARGFGLGRDLVVRILGKTRIRIHQDGFAVPLPGASDDHSFDASEFREIRLRALPGEIVAFELKLPESAPTFLLKDHKEVPYAELFLKATYDGKDIKREGWQAGSADQLRASRPKVGGILFAEIGPNHSIKINDEYPICMNYADPNVKGKDNAIIIDAGMSVEEIASAIMDSIFEDLLSPASIHYDDAHKALEAKVKEPKTGFVWVTTVREKAVYFLVVPRDDSAK